MVLVKQKYFKIGDYVYDSRRNFYWFKIIDNHFHEIALYLEKFQKFYMIMIIIS